ncbi:hypothetical protein ACSQ67_005315 [Phaseolus vulgaris]
MGSHGFSNHNNGQQQRLGITEPISLGGPTEYDVIKTRELEKHLQDAGLYENQDEAVSREEVLGRLDQIVKIWVKTISRGKGLNEELVQEANAKIFTFGSYRLGVHGPGADIDILCVGPRYASRDEDFFGELHKMLSEMTEVTELHPVPDAHVPVMRLKLNGVSIDLLYAKLSLWVIPENLDISQESILQNADEQTVRSLNGCRVTDQVTGFLGGINWALLVALICQLFPNAVPNMLVSRFFRVYTKWRWPNPVMLCGIEEGSLGLQVWDPRRYPKDRSHLMPIITPAYPCMNSSYNVSSSTLRIIMKEFHRGNEICEIDISAENAHDLRKWKGWVESRLRHLTLKIERHTYDMLQCHPHPGDFPDKSRPYHCSYFMGLQRKQGVPLSGAQKFDIRTTVEEFKHSVNMYTLWKPGMDVHVSHVKRDSIPSFVFPGAVRPSHPSKVTWHSKRSSELSTFGHAHAEESEEGKVFVLGGNGDRKRKVGEDSVDSLRSSKSLASLSPCSREVDEDGNPDSIGSCWYEKCDDSEMNGSGEEQGEKPDLEDGEKVAIEKIKCGSCDSLAQHVFSEEPDELTPPLLTGMPAPVPQKKPLIR